MVLVPVKVGLVHERDPVRGVDPGHEGGPGHGAEPCSLEVDPEAFLGDFGEV